MTGPGKFFSVRVVMSGRVLLRVASLPVCVRPLSAVSEGRSKLATPLRTARCLLALSRLENDPVGSVSGFQILGKSR